MERYLSERAFRVTQEASAQAGASPAAVPSTEALRHRLAADALKLDEVRTLTLRTPSRGYVNAEVDITVDHLAASGPAEVTVGATERTKLYFGHGDPSAPQFEAYRLRHEFTFVDRNGTWTLATATPKLEGGGPSPAPHVGAVAAQRQVDSPPPIPGKLPSANAITAQAAGRRHPWV